MDAQAHTRKPNGNRGIRAGGRNAQGHRPAALRKLELLCESSVGLPAIASEFCRICCELGGFDGAFLMWFAPDETPLGFYHNTAPAELKDLFISRFDAMFFASEDISSLSLARPGGPVFGRMLAPGMQARFREGNIYRLLCAPLGHGDLFDISAVAPDGAFAGIALWLKDGEPLAPRHFEPLRPVQPLMARAIGQGGQNTRWRTISAGAPHFMTCDRGETLLAMDGAAEQILMRSQLLRQNVRTSRPPRDPPSFVQMMLAPLASERRARIELPVPDGRLVCSAVTTRLNPGSSGSGADAILCMLDLQQAEDVIRVDRLMETPLTQLQRQIALFGMQGGRRQDCAERFGVSIEALKKHVRAILHACGCDRWSDLARID